MPPSFPEDPSTACCLGPAGFRNPSAEAQTRLRPRARYSDRPELPRIHLFAAHVDEHVAFGFALVQSKRCLGAGGSPNLSSGAPQRGAPQVLVLKQMLLGIPPPPMPCYFVCFPNPLLKLQVQTQLCRSPPTYGAGEVPVLVLCARNKPGAQTPPLMAGAELGAERGGPSPPFLGSTH